jgi:hypothetical protein
VSPPLKSFEGPDVQLLLDQIRVELGPDAKIDGAQKIRVGGVLGFFAREHFRVTVEIPEPADDPAPAPPSPSTPLPSSTSDRLSSELVGARSSGARSSPATSGSTSTMPSPSMASDVFTAMAEATDDVNDIGASMAPLLKAPVPSAPAEAVIESFDAVLTRVATTLDGPGQAHDSHPGYGLGGQPTPFPADVPAAVPAAVPTDDFGPEPAGIASDAALFLAGNPVNDSPLSNGSGRSGPVLDDPVAVALVRTGLEESLVGALAEGLAGGGDLQDLLLEAFGALTAAPPLPRRPGSLLVVVGDGAPARRLAAALADEMGIDPTAVPLASLDRQAHVHATGRLLVRSAEDAAELAPGWRRSAPAVVVVDACVSGPHRSWATHLIASMRPTAVWGVVDSTSKTDDITDWVEALGGIDALALENLDATVSPAAALRVGVPVARLDGQPATAARWAATVVDRVNPCM